MPTEVEKRPSVKDEDVMVNVRMSSILADEARRNAINMGLSFSAYMRLALSQANFESQRRLVERTTHKKILNDHGELLNMPPPRPGKPMAFKKRQAVCGT